MPGLPIHPSKDLHDIIALLASLVLIFRQRSPHHDPYMNYSHCWTDKPADAEQRILLPHLQCSDQELRRLRKDIQAIKIKRSEYEEAVWLMHVSKLFKL